MTVLQNSAKHFGINHGQLARLRSLANVAASAQEREHNEPNAPSSDRATKAVEDYAKSFGFGTIWPGLYPVFTKNGQQFHLPE